MSKASLSSSPIVHPISHSFPVFSSLAHLSVVRPAGWTLPLTTGD
ncbi:uncharacterized protein RCO7_14876 [Rhynchosporium graminicola]|uniref:Uncharacterized protein n=2 Tax=Rhynchosporium TaxID=38037 RepID=A0A1E1M826_RHYSE|nr:uncharacterized protein RCO7_14876 [Rhynchosporium commune]CZT45253.1 uncharacterized protein RSE6_05547 [Rhynchosporium secalis]